MKTQWDLGLNETIEVVESTLTIRRVPGGWIYWSYYIDDPVGAAISQVFVPYSEDFNPANELFGPIGSDEEESE